MGSWCVEEWQAEGSWSCGSRKAGWCKPAAGPPLALLAAGLGSGWLSGSQVSLHGAQQAGAALRGDHEVQAGNVLPEEGRSGAARACACIGEVKEGGAE